MGRMNGGLLRVVGVVWGGEVCAVELVVGVPTAGSESARAWWSLWSVCMILQG